MARQREYMTYTNMFHPSEDLYFEADSLISPGEDFYDSVSPSENIWKKFELLTPPVSPHREDDDECFASCEQLLRTSTSEEEWLSTTICIESKGLKSKLIQDCMWSGSDEEKARSTRNRKVSLSELTMQTASTSCVDPTTFSAYPRQQNQVEHSYSLTTPEPMRVPALYTPVATDDSESEEDVIDVVTVDTRTQSSSTTTVYPNKTTKVITSQHKVQNDLQAVAKRLDNDSYKRPKCMSDHDFALPSKRVKRYHHHSSSLLSSQNSSDNEDFEGRRSAHNVMERQRRNDLKNSLHLLRDCLPTLETQERAPKVVILAHATDYVRSLQKQEALLRNEYIELKSKNRLLKEKLENLQSHFSLVEF